MKKALLVHHDCFESNLISKILFELNYSITIVKSSNLKDKQLKEVQFAFDMQIEKQKMGATAQKEVMIEDRKDTRSKQEATQQSQLTPHDGAARGCGQQRPRLGEVMH